MIFLKHSDKSVPGCYGPLVCLPSYFMFLLNNFDYKIRQSTLLIITHIFFFFFAILPLTMILQVNKVLHQQSLSVGHCFGCRKENDNHSNISPFSLFIYLHSSLDTESSLLLSRKCQRRAEVRVFFFFCGPKLYFAL